MPSFMGMDTDGESESRRRLSAIVLAIGLIAVVFVLGLVVRGGPLPIDTAVADGLAVSFPPTATQLFNALGELPVFGAVGLLGAVICLRSLTTMTGPSSSGFASRSRRRS